MTTDSDKIRGSINVPLSSKGANQARTVGQKFAASGGAHEIVSSVLNRTLDTGRAIQAANPRAKLYKTPALQSWGLGMYEGQPQKAVQGKIKGLIANPNRKAPGRSAQSTSAGESLNGFKKRYLPHMRAEIHDSVTTGPKKKIIVTHGRGVKLMQAWAKAGAKPDLGIDPSVLTDYGKNDGPGTIHYLDPEVFAGIKPGIPTVDPATDLTKDGIYMVRHGVTGMNIGIS